MGLVRSRAVALMCGVALGTVALQGAAAQSNVNTTNVTLLERLVIGLGGAPKVAIDTPQAVTVVSQKDIDQAQASTTGEIFDSVPGVTIVGSDRQLGEAFNIRGIGTTENSSDGSRVIVTVDGAPKFNEQYRMGSFFSDPELYKQVEVLRGPASSTLYGAGALGGVINFTTKDASDFIADGATGAVRVKEALSSNGLGTTTSVVLAHRGSENLDLLATGNWRRSNNLDLAQGVPLTGSALSTWSGLAKGTVRFGDDNEQVLRASYQRWYSEAFDQAYAQTGTGGRGGLIVGRGAPATIGDMFGIIDRKVTDQTAVLSYENPDSDNPWVDLNVNLSWSDTQNNQYNHRSSTGVRTPQTGTNVLADTIYGYRTIQLKADNTVEWIGENFENYFTFGLQTSSMDRTVSRAATALPLPAHPEGNEAKLGLFAQDEVIFNEQLTVVAGLRGDFHWVKATAGGIADIQGSAFSPKLAAHYEINDSVSVFGSVAHTERLPTIDELYSVSDAVAATVGPPASAGSAGKVASLGLRKEQANTIEGGFAVSGYDLLQDGDTVSVKTTGFYSDLTDLIASTGTAPVFGRPAPAYYANIATARIYGVEIEGAYDSDNFFASLAYTFTVGDDLVGNKPLTTVPQNKVVATLGARNSEWNLEYGARATVAAAGAYAMATADGADGPSGAFQTVDVFASWKPDAGQFKGLEAQFSIENIFNADYRESLSADRSKGRTFKLTLAKQFDY